MDIVLEASAFGGESDAELTRWLVKSGDRVDHGQIIAELESGKAVYEVPAPMRGLIKILIDQGEIVGVGTVIASIIP